MSVPNGKCSNRYSLARSCNYCVLPKSCVNKLQTHSKLITVLSSSPDFRLYTCISYFGRGVLRFLLDDVDCCFCKLKIKQFQINNQLKLFHCKPIPLFLRFFQNFKSSDSRRLYFRDIKMIILIFNLLQAFWCFKVPKIDTREFIIENIHQNFFDFPQVRSTAQDWLILNTPEDLLWKTRCYERNCDNGGICERYTSLKFMKYTHKCICNSPWTG